MPTRVTSGPQTGLPIQSGPLIQSDAAGQSVVPATPCLTPAVLEGLLEGCLGSDVQSLAEQHLAECGACNQRLLESAGTLPAGPDQRARVEPLPSAQTWLVLEQVAKAAPFPAELFARQGPAPAPVALSAWAGFDELSFVGRGGSGTVYRARQASLGRWVALKVLSSETTPKAANRAQREAQALASLNHPHVVTVHEADLLGSPPCLVMEWVAGGSLHDRLLLGPLPIDEATRLARQLAEGVVAVHALGLIHRDLKPANVLLSRPVLDDGVTVDRNAPFTAKITDFGLALTDESGIRTTQEGLAVGTPAYMAPEQTGLRLQLGRIGPACDIYGLGAVLFAALTARPPHEAETPMATLAHVAWEEAPWLRRLRADVPIDLATIVAKCLRSVPAERYRSARDLLDDLERFQRGEPILARSYTPREKLRNWMRRHPTLAVAMGLGGTLLLAIVLGATYHLTQLRRSLADLRLEQQRVSSALARAEEATEAEKALRRETVRQVAIAHRVMLESLQHKEAVSYDDSNLLRLIREFYHEQLRQPSAAGVSIDLAEILGEGLTTLCVLEARVLTNPTLAEEDSQLLLQLSATHPHSAQLQSNRAHVLHVRWQMFRQHGRDDAAEQTLNEIIELAEWQGAHDSPPVSRGLRSNLMAILWQAGDWPRVLTLVEQALRHEVGRHDHELRTAESWQTQLSLQSQRVGLLHRLERWNDSELAFAEWLRVSQQLQSRSPALGRQLWMQQLRMVSQHLQHAGPHLGGNQQAALMSLGRDLFALLSQLDVKHQDRILASIDWTMALESLPEGTVSSDELESTRQVNRRLVATADSEDLQVAILPPLTALRLVRTRRAFEGGQFSEVLQQVRRALADLDLWWDRLVMQQDPMRWELLDLAARASRALGRPAEELAYLSRAADEATGEDRAAFRRRLEQTAREQGIWLGPPDPAAAVREPGLPTVGGTDQGLKAGPGR